MNLLRDLRFGVRTLGRNPSYAAAALAVVALGIGATTAVFTVVRTVLLQPLPYRDADRLVTFRADSRTVSHAPALTPEEYAALRERTDLFDDVGTVNDSRISITGVDDMETVPSASISDNLFALFGTAPVIGRPVNAHDDIGQPYIRAVNISEELWQRRWHADPALLGRHIEVNNIDVVVVGIVPRGFRVYLGPGTNVAERIDIWVAGAPDVGGTARSVPAVARLRRGVTLAAAQHAVDALMPALMAAHAASYRLGPVTLTLTRLDADVVRDVKPALIALAGAVGFVLLIACANLTNLLLARACARTRELAVRRAIGASRTQLIAQIVTESVVLWGAGAAAGLVVAQWGIVALVRLAPAALPRREYIGIDGSVAVFATMVSLVCAIVFGLLPAVQATREDVTGMLKQDPASAPGAGVTRGVLVAAQLALSLVLLVGAGLMVRAFVSLRNVPLGFEPSRVLTMNVEIHHLGGGPIEDRLAFFGRVADEVRRVPGVAQAALGLPIPLSESRLTQRYAIDERSPEQVASGLIALPRFVETLGVAVRAGRSFREEDNARLDPIILVDERLASAVWPGENAVGRKLLLGPGSGARQWAEVIGVVSHLQLLDLRGDTRPQIWSTYRAKPYFSMSMIVRAAGDPRALAGAVRKSIERLGLRRPVMDIRPLEDYVADASADTRFALFVLGAFAALAVILTGIGVYGVVAYTTARRTREIAVRLALGADGRRIVALVIRDGLAWTAAGLASGLAAAFGLTRYLSSLLFGVGEHDPITLAAVAALLAAVALVATALPAIRAVRVDPMLALRSE
jgi:putative ABC transport system permease protein